MIDALIANWNMVFYVPVIIILLLIAYQDLTSYKIGNKKVLFLLILFPIYLIIDFPDFLTLSISFSFAIGILLFGFLLYWLRVLGAGDVKLYAVLALWFGPKLFFYSFIISSIFGFFFIVLVIFFRMLKEEQVKKYAPFLLAVYKRKKGFPYGVPISFGAIVIFTHMLNVITL